MMESQGIQAAVVLVICKRDQGLVLLILNYLYTFKVIPDWEKIVFAC